MIKYDTNNEMAVEVEKLKHDLNNLIKIKENLLDEEVLEVSRKLDLIISKMHLMIVR